jgi:hypothetical protein
VGRAVTGPAAAERRRAGIGSFSGGDRIDDGTTAAVVAAATAAIADARDGDASRHGVSGSGCVHDSACDSHGSRDSDHSKGVRGDGAGCSSGGRRASTPTAAAAGAAPSTSVAAHAAVPSATIAAAAGGGRDGARHCELHAAATADATGRAVGSTAAYAAATTRTAAAQRRALRWRAVTAAAGRPGTAGTTRSSAAELCGDARGHTQVCSTPTGKPARNPTTYDCIAGEHEGK